MDPPHGVSDKRDAAPAAPRPVRRLIQETAVEDREWRRVTVREAGECGGLPGLRRKRNEYAVRRPRKRGRERDRQVQTF